MAKKEERKHEYEEKNKYEGGATRSKSPYAFHLIPTCALSVMSDRWALGAIKHGEGNWKAGGVEFIKQCFNHMLNHYVKEVEHNYDKDIALEISAYGNLGAMLWAAGALVWFKKYKPLEYAQAIKELNEGKFEAVRKED